MNGGRIAPEFPRPIAVEQLREQGADVAIEANAAERAALAARFGILAIDSLAAEIHLRPIGRGMVRLSGHLKAVAHQACVVTLADVPQTIDQTFERLYAPSVAEPDRGEQEAPNEIEVGYDEEEPDPLVDGVIDIGEAAAEELALALDPYPRAPGAVFEAPAEEGETKSSPFAALAKLKKKE